MRAGRQLPPFLRSPTTPKRPRMLKHARLPLALSVLALLASCGGDAALGPVGGDFTVGQSLNVESGRDAHVVGGSTGGSFLAVVVNLALDSSGQSSYNLRARGIEA